MKKLLYILFVLFLQVLFCPAQNLDSLSRVYNNKTYADTNRLKAIHIIAWSYTGNNPDTAIALATLELELANSISSEKGKRGIAHAYNTIGVSYMNKNNYPKAVVFYLKALKIREEIKDKKGIG